MIMKAEFLGRKNSVLVLGSVRSEGESAFLGAISAFLCNVNW